MDTKGGKLRWGGDGGVLNWAIGIDMYTLMCIKVMTNKNLQYKQTNQLKKKKDLFRLLSLGRKIFSNVDFELSLTLCERLDFSMLFLLEYRNHVEYVIASRTKDSAFFSKANYLVYVCSHFSDLLIGVNTMFVVGLKDFKTI